MFRTAVKLLKILFYFLLLLLAVTFTVSNRGTVELTLFPLPYVFSTRIFFFTIIIFLAGLLVGWVIARVSVLKGNKAHRQAKERAAALENELSAIRTEQFAKPLPRK